MKKLLSLSTTMLAASAVLSSSILMCCSKNMQAVNTKKSIKNNNIINATQSGTAIFKNYNPKYDFAVFDDGLKWEMQDDGSYLYHIDFGYNMDYIDAVFYWTSLFVDGNVYKTSKFEKILPSRTDFSKSSTYISNVLENTTFKTAYSQSGIREIINKAIFDGKLFCQPYGAQPYQNPVFNRTIKNAGGDKKFTINKYDINYNSTSWPHRQNLVYLSANADQIAQILGKPSWWMYEEYWKKVINEFDTLRWKVVCDKFGVDCYERQTGTTPYATFDDNDDRPVDTLDYQVSALLLDNIGVPEQSVKMKAVFSPQTPLIESSPHENFDLSCITDPSSSKRQSILTLTVSKENRTAFLNWYGQHPEFAVTITSTNYFHYFSPFYDDFFVCSYADKTKLPGKSYYPSHQLHSDPSGWSTKDQTGAAKTDIIVGSIAPNATEYKKPEYHKLIQSSKLSTVKVDNIDCSALEPLYPDGYTGKKCYLCSVKDDSKKQFPDDFPEEYKTFNKDNLNIFLYSITPAAIKSLFDNGKLDTRVYEYDYVNDKYTTEVKYEMWGDIQAYRSTKTDLTDSDKLSTASPFFIEKDDTYGTNVSREAIDKSLLGEVTEISISRPVCNIINDNSIDFHFTCPVKMNESEITKIENFETEILSSFAIPFKFKPTLNTCDRQPIDLYKDPIQMKNSRIKYSSDVLRKLHLFETSLDKKQIMNGDDPVPDPQIFKDETIPTDQKGTVPLWPTKVATEVGDTFYDWEHCGIEVTKTEDPENPGISENLLCIHYNFSPDQITDKYASGTKSPFYFAKAKLVSDPKLVVKYTFPDYSTQPKESLPVNWSITSGSDIATIDSNTGVLTTVPGKSGNVQIKATEQETNREALLDILVAFEQPSDPPTPPEQMPGQLYINGTTVIINDMVVSKTVKYDANNPATVYTVDDQRKISYKLGSSFNSLEVLHQEATGTLFLDWESEETQANKELLNDEAVFEHFDILNDKYVTRDPETGKVTGFVQGFEIKSAEDLKVDFKLIKETLTKESIKFGFRINIHDKETHKFLGSLTSDEGIATIIPQVNPQEKIVDTWTDASGQKLSENCFKHKGDNVFSSLVLDDLYKSKHMTIDQFKSATTKFILDITEPESQHYEFDKVLISSNEESVSYQIGILDPATAQLKEVWYTVVYTEKEISSNAWENKKWNITFKITQEFEDTKIGKLSLKYANTGTAAELAFDWYTGKPKSPEPTPPPGPDPDPETKTWWTLGHIFGLVGTVAASVAIIMSITAIAKNRKAIKKKQEEELKHS